MQHHTRNNNRRQIFCVCLLVFFVTGCAGGTGSGGDAASESLFACSMDPRLDEALARAVLTIQERLTTDIWDDVTPRGMLSAQRTILHELMHAAAERIDHVLHAGNIMHHHHAPRERVLGPDDHEYLEGSREVRGTDDMGLCDVDVRFGAPQDLGCPEHASGCWHGEHIVLNEHYAWYMP